MPHTELRTVYRHPLAHLELYIAAIILAATAPWFGWPMVLLGGFIAVIGEVARRAHVLVLYDDGVMRQYKLITVDQSFIEYHDIQGVDLTQSFFERMFGLGTIHIDTAGGDAKELEFNGIKDPHDIEAIIRKGMSAGAGPIGNPPPDQAAAPLVDSEPS